MNKALIVVDVQNDFCPGGSLATKRGDEVAENIRDHILKDGWVYRLLLATKDWHPDDDNFPHFSNDPDYVDTWPKHCVAKTDGADFNPALKTILFDKVFYKGQTSAAYSGFEGISMPRRTENEMSLDQYLKRYAINDLVVCGIATDYCVKATALDAIGLEYNVSVPLHLCSPVSPEGAEEAERELLSVGVNIER